MDSTQHDIWIHQLHRQHTTQESHAHENKKLVKQIKANELEHNQMGSLT
jgi:hypothetical protein